MDLDAVKATKAALRKRLRDQRAALSNADYVQKSEAICHAVHALPELQAARTLHIYWPLLERREVDTRALIFSLHAEKKQIVLPVVLTFTDAPDDTPSMTHRRFEGPAAMRSNRWGIPEPVGTEAVSPGTLDVVIVPALGADRNGRRIGYGKGFYDAFLRGLSIPRIGLVFHDGLVDAVPAEPHDVPLTAVVTELEVVRPPV